MTVEKTDTSDEKILLKLHREFDKDEAIQFLFKHISHLKFTIGELRSENAEHKDIIEEHNKKVTLNPDWKKDIYVAQLKQEIADLNKKVQTLSKEMRLYRDKYFATLQK